MSRATGWNPVFYSIKLNPVKYAAIEVYLIKYGTIEAYLI